MSIFLEIFTPLFENAHFSAQINPEQAIEICPDNLTTEQDPRVTEHWKHALGCSAHGAMNTLRRALPGGRESLLAEAEAEEVGLPLAPHEHKRALLLVPPLLVEDGDELVLLLVLGGAVEHLRHVLAGAAHQAHLGVEIEDGLLTN